MAPDPVPFNPDWTIAPSETLNEWMEVNGVSRIDLIARCDPGAFEEHAGAVVDRVLARDPLTTLMARTLERGTGIPAQTWLNLERGYRADLEAGRKDMSEAVTTEFREQAAGLMDSNDGLMRRLAGTEDVTDR